MGNNLYVMSPQIDVGNETHSFGDYTLYGNGLAIVNGNGNSQWLPNSATLFQPSEEEYVKSNILEFIEWYEGRNGKTRVRLDDTYGTNVTKLKWLGNRSYEIWLSTYCPSHLLIMDDNGNVVSSHHMDNDTFREIRKGNYNDAKYDDGTYVFNNGDLKSRVGFMFNLYDSFISEQDRTISFDMPKDKDFNQLEISFDWMRYGDLDDDFDFYIMLNEEKVFDTSSDGEYDGKSNSFKWIVNGTAIQSHRMNIVVNIKYDVDYAKRNTVEEYRQNLVNSGILISNIRISNGVSNKDNLTFGSYVNEDGLDENERTRRYEQFWQVSRYVSDIPSQSVIEISLKNIISYGIEFKNNYSSGDLYGEAFLAKCHLDPQYDMNVCRCDNDNWLSFVGRKYIGLGQCSNQLSLTYNPIDILVREKDNAMVAREIDCNSQNFEKYANRLKYQMVEVIRNVNRFESSIKHKSNVFSIVVQNSNLAKDNSIKDDDESGKMLEEFKEKLRNSVTQFVRNTCEGIVPVHTQLFDVQFS